MNRWITTAVLPALLWVATAAQAEFPTTRPYPGITYARQTRAQPAERIFIVTADLSNPKVKLRVCPAGEDPDGPGPWQTVLLPPSEVAKREGLEVTVNASFFDARNTKDAEGAASGYVRGKWAKPVGMAMTDGKLWAPQVQPNYITFWIDRSGAAHLGEIRDVPAGAKQVVQGNAWILRDGKPVKQTQKMMNVRHPRTAIGLDKSGRKVLLLVVDGRKPGVSVGMTGDEMAAELRKLGVENAMNLDGGGSTTLVLRDPSSGEQKVMNTPSDTRERAVADVVGIEVAE